MAKVLSTVASFEELKRKYHEEYGAHPLTVELTVDALKCIIPLEIERSINLNLIGRPDPTYEELKKLVTEYIVNNTPAPMEIGEIDEQPSVAATDWAETEFVNSLGAAGVGVGKGKGAGKGKGTGAAISTHTSYNTGKGRQPIGSCNICWQMGHYGLTAPTEHLHRSERQRKDGRQLKRRAKERTRKAKAKVRRE